MENSPGVSAVASGAAEGSAATVPTTSGDPHNSVSDSARQADSPNQHDDPEWDFGEGKRFKRSDAIKRVKDLEKGMYKSHERAAAVSKKFDALTQSLSKFGITAEQFLEDPDAHMSRAAQELIARQVDESLMDPKDLELSKREKAIAEREAKIKEQDDARTAKEAEAREVQRAEQYAAEMAPVLKTAGLPANPKTVKRMAEVAAQALRQGIKLDMTETATYVAQQIRQEQEWHLNQYQDPEALVSALGPQRLEMIRQHLIARARQGATPQQPAPRRPTPSRPATQPRDERSQRYIGWDEWTKSKRF